jgi:predicted small secreted protein
MRLLFLATVATVSLLAGCNTIAGVGDDVSGGARKVQSWF